MALFGGGAAQDKAHIKDTTDKDFRADVLDARADAFQPGHAATIVRRHRHLELVVGKGQSFHVRTIHFSAWGITDGHGLSRIHTLRR